MKDNWKKFIDENRDDFESESPRDIFHQKIAPLVEQKSQPKMVRLSVVLKVAAAFLILLGVSLVLILQQGDASISNETSNEQSNVKDERLVLAKVDPQLAEAEYYYVTQIDKLMKEVEERKLSDDVKELIKQLDTEFNLLKKEIGDQVNGDQIIEAMIENYRIKIKLLEKILNSYADEKNNSYEKETAI